MAPIYMARARAGGRHREPLREADRRRLPGALPAHGPSAL
jgi:hypothetical protein